MPDKRYFEKLGFIYADFWAAGLIWLSISALTPNWLDELIFPAVAAGILFYPSIATGLICNRITEMGRWLFSSLVGMVSAITFVSLLYTFSPSGIEIAAFYANGFIWSALITIGTISSACFVGKYRYALAW